MTQRLRFLALVLTVSLLPGAAQAELILFDLEEEAATLPPFGSPGIPSLALTSGGVTMTITRENGANFHVQQPFSFPAELGDRVLSPFATGGAHAFLANLSQPTFFFGLDFGDIGNDHDVVTLQAFSGPNQTGTLLTSQTFGQNPNNFPGIESIQIGGPNPALSLRFFSTATESNGNPGIPNTVYFDNLRLSTTPVPEPASLLLLATGLAAVALHRRRQG